MYQLIDRHRETNWHIFVYKRKLLLFIGKTGEPDLTDKTLLCARVVRLLNNRRCIARMCQGIIQCQAIIVCTDTGSVGHLRTVFRKWYYGGCIHWLCLWYAVDDKVDIAHNLIKHILSMLFWPVLKRKCCTIIVNYIHSINKVPQWRLSNVD